VLGIGHHRGTLAGETGRFPIAEGEQSLTRPRAHSDAAAILLRAVQPVRETIVGRNVVHLSGRLVVPGTPTLAAIHAHDRALVSGENHAIAVARIDPKLMVVVAARRTLERREGLAAVGGDIGGGVDHIRPVGIGGVDGYGGEVPSASPEAILIVDQLPRSAGI